MFIFVTFLIDIRQMKSVFETFSDSKDLHQSPCPYGWMMFFAVHNTESLDGANDDLNMCISHCQNNNYLLKMSKYFFFNFLFAVHLYFQCGRDDRDWW